MGVEFFVIVLAEFDETTKTWIDISHEGWESDGRVWTVGQNGQTFHDQVKFLCDLFKWDGDPASLLKPFGAPGAFVPCEFIAPIKRDEFPPGSGRVKFDMGWIEGDRPLSEQHAMSMVEKMKAAFAGKPIPRAKAAPAAPPPDEPGSHDGPPTEEVIDDIPF